MLINTRGWGGVGGCLCKWSEDFHHTRSSKNTQPEIVQLDGHFCEGGTIEGCWHTANPNSNVFLTWNGEPMVSSQINKAIKSVWKKAQVDGNPSSTLPRKLAVSRVHTASDSNEARGNLADLMAHILQTANKYYRLQEKSKSSVQASKQLRSIMREQSDHPDQTAKPNYFCQPKPICFRGCCPQNLERFMERGQGSSYQDSFQGWNWAQSYYLSYGENKNF